MNGALKKILFGTFSVEKARYALIMAAVSTIRVHVQIEKIKETAN
ncbi:MAG: hypothetical protein V1882_03790 [Candidatus Omnitrophota bacterium]